MDNSTIRNHNPLSGLTDTASLRNTAKLTDASDIIRDSFIPTDTDDTKKEKVTNLGTAASMIFAKKKHGIDSVWTIDLGEKGRYGSVSPVLREDGIYLNSRGVTRKISYEGKELWSVPTEGSDSKAPSFDSRGNLYVMGSETLTSLDSNGKVRWKRDVGGRGSSHDPYIAHDKIFIVTNDREVFCFSPDGKKEWSVKVDRAQSTAPFLDDRGILHLECYSGVKNEIPLLKLDTNKMTGIISKKPKIIQDGSRQVLHYAAIDSDGNTFGFKDGKFRARDARGKELWAVSLPGNTTSVSTRFTPEGNILVRVRDHTMLSLKPDGTEQWRRELSDLTAAIYTIAFAEDGTMYQPVHGRKGSLQAINPDGTLKWEISDVCNFNSLQIAPDGTIHTWHPFRAIAPDGTVKISGDDVPREISHGTFIGDGDFIAVTSDNKLVRLHNFTVEERADEAADKHAQENKPSGIVKTEEGIELDGVTLTKKKKRFYHLSSMG